MSEGTESMDKTQTTIHSYNANAKAYAGKFMEYAPYVSQVNEFAKFLAPDDEVLDVGCGPGNVAKQLLAAKPLKITGIDLSGEMVRLAAANVPTGKFLCQDIRQAEFPSRQFDAVILSFSIVHLNDAEAYALLRKAGSWLKDKGVLYLSFMAGKKAGFEQTSFSQDPIYFKYFNRDEVERFLSRQGVTVFHSAEQGYLETDGTLTNDIFLFGKRL